MSKKLVLFLPMLMIILVSGCTTGDNNNTQEKGVCAEPGSGCMETDNFTDIYQRGQCTDPSGKYDDVCYTETGSVQEFYCKGEICDFEYMECPEGTVCEVGKCVELPTPPEPETINCDVECSKTGSTDGGVLLLNQSRCHWKFYHNETGCCCLNFQLDTAINCRDACANEGYPNDSYPSNDGNCTDFSHYFPELHCCCI